MTDSVWKRNKYISSPRASNSHNLSYKKSNLKRHDFDFFTSKTSHQTQKNNKNNFELLSPSNSSLQDFLKQKLKKENLSTNFNELSKQNEFHELFKSNTRELKKMMAENNQKRDLESYQNKHNNNNYDFSNDKNRNIPSNDHNDLHRNKAQKPIQTNPSNLTRRDRQHQQLSRHSFNNRNLLNSTKLSPKHINTISTNTYHTPTTTIQQTNRGNHHEQQSKFPNYNTNIELKPFSFSQEKQQTPTLILGQNEQSPGRNEGGQFEFRNDGLRL